MRHELAITAIMLIGCRAHDTASKTAQRPPILSVSDDGSGGLGLRGSAISEAQFTMPTQVHGSLMKDVIRGVIRTHLNEIRACYEPELAKLPTLDGTVMVQFTISAEGGVIASVVQNSTLNNASVEGCAVTAVRGWTFPKPTGGGVVIVSYPFKFRPQPTSTP